MNDPTFALLVLLTTAAWLIVFYCVYDAWRRRKSTPSNQMVGHINRIFSDEHGVHVQGTLNDADLIRRRKSQANGLSLGFHDLGYIRDEDSGVTTITKAKFHNASLDTEPSPYGGNIDFVGTQPDER